MKRQMKKSFVLLLAFLVLITSFSVPAASIHANTSEAGDAIIRSQEQAVQSADEKIEAEVQQALEDNEYVEVLIQLADQVDTAQVAAETKQTLTQSVTAYQQKMESRFAVVDALKTTAETSQASVLSYLEQESENGNVEHIRSFYIMNMIAMQATEEVIEELSRKPEIASIKLDEKFEIEVPEEVDSSSAVALTAEDDSVEWNIDRIQAPDVWDTYNIDGDGVVVGVIDTGVDWTHEALQQQWRGYDPEDPDNPDPHGNWFDVVDGEEMPFDEEEIPHGTHVTGTILGQDEEGENKIGVAPGAQWIAVRAFEFGWGQDSWLLEAGEYMLAPEGDPTLAPDIINNSWGGDTSMDEWYRPMVEAWRDAGIMPVFAAGNSGPGEQTVENPANYPESYAVAATDSEDQVADFSSRGPSPYNGEQKPNISAPGVEIRSSVPGGYESEMWSGTSMASPHVAGTAALLLSTDTSLSVDDIEDILDATATPLTDDQYTDVPNDGYGVGLVNAYEAVTLVTDGLSYFEGHVRTEGTDTEPPEIEHESLQLAYEGIDVPVRATITDDVAITKAEIWLSTEEYKYDIVIPMEQRSGDHLEAQYEAHIPWMFIKEPGFDYAIRAYDYGNNYSETDRFDVQVEFGVTPDEYSEDFAEFPHGWIMDGDWEWGEPTSGPEEAAAGDHVIATNLDGSYSENTVSQLLLPALDLRNTEEASLRLQHWYHLQEMDFGFIAVSGDYGENWNIVEDISGEQTSWEPLYIDLNEYAGGEDPVLVAFVLTSSIGRVDGWYVDDLHLVGEDTEAPAAPDNVTAERTTAGVSLAWEAPADLDVAGYHIYRTDDQTDEYEQIGSTAKPAYTDSDVQGDTEYEYVVTAYDYAENESDYSDPVSIVAPHVEVVFETDFENDNGGFTEDGESSSWEWGEPASGPGEAYSGTHLWATNLDGLYNSLEDSWLESPVIDLSEATTAELQFTHWFDIEEGWDFGFLEASVVGEEEWQIVSEYTGISTDWITESVSLDDFVGEEIELRFALVSDDIIEHEGWYVNDFAVYTSTDDAETEQNAHANVQNSASLEQLDAVERKQQIEEARDTLQKEADGDGHEYKHPEIDLQIRQDEEAYTYYESNDIQVMSADGLPVDGTVTVLETDRTVRTNPVDGSYSMLHPASDEGDTWTLRAEGYGFYPQEAEVALGKDETVQQNFMLEPIPRGTVAGTVVDERTEEPVENATVRIMEDQRVAKVETDEDGTFVIDDVLEGEYTLRITEADYYAHEVSIEVEGEQTTEVSVELRPFIGFEEEIAYDDGTAEDAIAFFEPDNGFAVRMTPEETAYVKGANLYLWGDDFPEPGGNKFAVAVFDSDEDGEPGEMVIEPVKTEGERGEWNYVDLSEHGFITDEDFYIVMIQTEPLDQSPALGVDMSSDDAGRSYFYWNGSLEDTNGAVGNVMIRADVSYSLDAPVMDSPEDETYTNEETIEVSGTVKTDSEVTIYNNGEEAAVVQTEDKAFRADIPLSEGENEIYAEAEIDSGVSDPSQTVTVIQDLTAPSLHIASPEDGMITNGEVITVQGFAYDDHLEGVYVNDKAVDVQEDGSYSTRIIVEEGENAIEIQARDLAGNETTEERTVIVDLSAPVMDNIQPAEDIHVSPGDEVTVSFSSDAEGGTASFTVNLPSGVGADEDAALSAANKSVGEEGTSDGSIEMEEVEPGQYVGTWVAPDIDLEGAIISIEHYDKASNRATAVAEGKITITSGNDTEKGKKGKEKEKKRELR